MVEDTLASAAPGLTSTLDTLGKATAASSASRQQQGGSGGGSSAGVAGLLGLGTAGLGAGGMGMGGLGAGGLLAGGGGANGGRGAGIGATLLQNAAQSGVLADVSGVWVLGDGTRWQVGQSGALADVSGSQPGRAVGVWAAGLQDSAAERCAAVSTP